MEPDEDKTQTHIVLTTGTMVSQYRIIEKIGGGGMGDVYLALDTRLNRKVALKFLPLHLCQDADCRKRFAREAQAAAGLDHPNIAAIHEVGEFHGRPFYAMQVVEGQSLKDVIAKEDLSIERVLDIVIQLCEGLQAAHDKGVIHRDIKPSNVLLDNHGRVRIVDFGLASIRGSDQLTKTGSTLGTIGYMSPEQVQGKSIDGRSDLFSVGIMLYELLAKENPFSRDNELAFMKAVCEDTPPRLTDYRSDTTDSLQRTIDKALEKNVEIRYQSAADLSCDLKRILEGSSGPKSAAVSHQSIAVLPFLDLSPDRDQEYFCDGLAEEIINALTKITGLRVIARTSAFVFKQRQADVRDVGRQLGVQRVLDGSVRKVNHHLRITVQLIDTTDGAHLWSERYDKELQDIFAIQDDISMAVVKQLSLQLAEKEKQVLLKRHTISATAFNYYLRGKCLYNERKPRSAQGSISEYQKAIDEDNAFAPAYAALADAYTALGMWRILPPEEAKELAQRAISKSLELDTDLADAHVSLATMKLAFEWDWSGIEKECTKAFASVKAHPGAHHIYAHCLEIVGRFEEALYHLDQALYLEPIAPGLNSCAAEILFYARRYQEAIEKCKTVLQMAPDYHGIYGYHGIAQALLGEPELGASTIQKGLDARGEDPRMMGLLGFTMAIAGKSPEVDSLLERLTRLSETRFVDPCFLAWIYAGQEKKEKAVGQLQLALDIRSPWAPWIGVDPLLDSLRRGRSFQTLVTEIGLG